MSDTKLIHRAIRRVAKWSVESFFSEIRVIGEENVPKHGPIIVTATHHNMMLDPAVLSVAFPFQRILHYWAKASLFANPTVRYIMTSAGNIPVDRKSKDRNALFRGTIEALSHGLPVALFPEGTSYTETRIMQVKDGAAWAALEYTKWAMENGKGEPLKIVPAGIVYTNKSKYRSRVVMEFGRPITMDPFIDDFLSEKEGAQRAAVKRLTATIERELVEATINAQDWDTLYAARMARDLLWADEKSINLDDFVPISQTLVDLFSTPDLVPNFPQIKRALLTYYSLLRSSHLTNSALSALPLPLKLSPHQLVSLPSRLRTLFTLLASTVTSVARLPLFLVPLTIHAPAYAFARAGARLAEDEEETQAQNKVVFGLLLLTIVYVLLGVAIWAVVGWSMMGLVAAVGLVSLFSIYHNSLIDDNYEHAKRLVAAWRILVGVWAPKRWDLSLSALAPYTSPPTPPENPWVDRNRRSRPPTPGATPPPTLPSSSSAAPPATAAASSVNAKPAAKSSKKKELRPPSRRLVRHVLRARIEAARALASLFEQLERNEGVRVRASSHLAKAYGGVVDPPPTGLRVETQDGVEGIVLEEPRGWRSAKEVAGFLRSRGAKVGTLKDRVAGDWAALSSEGEGTGAETDDEVTWMPVGGKD